MRAGRWWLPLLVAALGCAEGEDEGRAALFPADFMTTFTEARTCRQSHEHDLNYIRVFANDLAAAPYAALSPDVPYAPGALLVKAQYDDDACTQLVAYTVMARQEPGYATGTFDWRWQRLDADLNVLEDGPQPVRCLSCHAVHCSPPRGEGFELTCADDTGTSPQ